jgi:hypothetical protein
VSIGKSVRNLISYCHEFFQNFSQSLAICFELFSFREFVYSKIADSGPHLSAAARPDSCLDRVAPARQPPRSPCHHRRRQRPPRPRRPRPDRLVCAAVASPTPPASQPSRRPRYRPDRSLARRRHAAVRRSRAGEPLLLGRFPRTGAMPPPAHRAVPPHVAPRTVHLGVSAQWHPVKFYYFLIYSIHCKFKNLCRIHFNSENYETNFVGKV